MARKLALLVLVLLVALALWLWKGSAPDPIPLAAPEARASKPQALDSAQPENAPECERAEVAPTIRETTKATTARLVVICRAKETAAPLAEQQVHVYGSELKPGPIPEGTGVHGKLGEILMTGADGRVEFEVPPATALHLTANSRKFGANAYGTREIEPLKAGEQREVVLELATQDDARFCGRVISRETKQPIAAAEVHGGPRALETDSDGRFELPYATWSMVQISVLARGYAECDVSAQTGHETPEKALVLELERSCTLIGHLKDGASGKYVLQAMTEGYRLHEQDPGGMSGMGFADGDHKWSADFDATGRAEIPGLPPNAPLRVTLLDGHKTLVELPERVTIPPGATREVDLRASSTCKLTGLVHDDEGKPVADLTLWLLRSERGVRLYVNHFEGDERVGTAKTDAEGRFAFAKVSIGTWRLSPEAKFRMDDAEVAADEVAPVAMLVEIPAGETERQVELLVHRGLTITGKVLDPDGNPADQTNVSCDAAPIYVNSNGRKDGSFVLGPLAPGSYTLEADSYFGGFANSESVRAEAGARDVVLRLRHAGKLSGRVVDATTGEGVTATIAVGIPGDKTGRTYMPTSKPDGSFAVNSLLPGTYALGATTVDGRVGVLRGVEIVGGGDSHDLVIQVQPGARVRVRYAGALDFCSVHVEQDGVPVALDGVEKGTSKTFSAPVGSVRVVARLGGNGKEVVRELTLKAGEEQELVIKDED